MMFCRKKYIVVVLLVLFVFFATGCENKPGRIPERKSSNAVRLYPGENKITVPDGKTLYVFAANIPKIYNNRTAVEHFTVAGSDYKTGSRALIPESKSKYELMLDRPDVWYFEFSSQGGQRYCKSDMTYLTIGKEIVYYAQSNLNDGMDYHEIATRIETMIGDSLDDTEHECILKREREMMGLPGYDVDGTGFFHILFTDFGVSSVTGNSGIAGAYDSNQIRNSSYSNKADMFYINARYVLMLYNAYSGSDNFWEYVGEHHAEIIEKYGPDPFEAIENFLYVQVAYNVAGTLIHEYCHCLMDCNRCLNGGRMLSGSLFWIEGTANIVPYAMCGDFQDPSAVKTWIGMSESYNPDLSAGDRRSDIEYANYGAGPLFFGYILKKYGRDVFQSVLHYNKTNDENIRTIVRDCTGNSFETVYKDFLLEMISSCEGTGVRIDGSSGNYEFVKDWGFTLDVVESASGITTVTERGDVVYGEKYITKSKGNFSTDLNQLGWVLTKWEGSPSVLNVTGDVLCYALFV